MKVAVLQPQVDLQAAQRGKELFMQRCSACHAIESGQQSPERAAPNLRAIYGSSIKRMTINAQTQEVRRETVHWDDKKLDDYLKNPKMNQAGKTIVFEPVTKDQDRADLIAYLKSVKGKS
ncbi:hypothetical protein RhiTH_009428 [Rhizoctonia solani]